MAMFARWLGVNGLFPTHALRPCTRVRLLCTVTTGTSVIEAGTGSGTTFQYGEYVLAERIDKKRTNMTMFKLTPGKDQQWHHGRVSHEDIVGLPVGGLVRTSTNTGTGKRLRITRPTLDDYVVMMRRGAAPIYPKDAAAIVQMLDLYPGAKVLEAGTGSASLTLFLSRAVGPDGCVDTFELRKDHGEIAKRNYEAWAEANRGRGFPRANVNFRIGNLASLAVEDMEGDGALKRSSYDGAVLDMLDPATALPVVAMALKPGRSVAIYLPNVTQVLRVVSVVEALRLPFSLVKAIQVTHCHWNFSSVLRKHRGAPMWSTLPETQSAVSSKILSGGGPLPTDGQETIEPSSEHDTSTHTQPDSDENAQENGNVTESNAGEEKEGECTDPTTGDSVGGWERLRQLSKLDLAAFNKIRTESALNYLSRPAHRQDPHTAFLLEYRREYVHNIDC
eukprot:comp6294_c0_seq1/m.2099 comp6294_c0_seq1/g.2099  ORF comp6294_c0_seq1/g.2099 comp6294_c0_seq1/m.2099 type:complete len:448 (-) comp6294_c0_seq1:505-1848(-)